MITAAHVSPPGSLIVSLPYFSLLSVLCCSLLLPDVAVAAQDSTALNGTVARIEAADWKLESLQFGIEIDDDGLRGVVRIGRLELTAAEQVLTDTSIVCRTISFVADRIDCADAQINADFPAIGRQTITGDLQYERNSQAVRFELRDLMLANGKMSLQGHADQHGFQLLFDSTELQIDALLTLLNPFTDAIAGLSATGSARLRGSVHSGDRDAYVVALKAALNNAAMSNDVGTLVTDALHGDLSITARQQSGRYEFDLDLQADRGEVYVEPVYANLNGHALTVRVRDAVTADFVQFQLANFSVQQDSVLDVGGTVQVSLGQDEQPTTVSGRIVLGDSSVDTLYSSGLQILAAGTLFADLETAGRVSGRFDIADNFPLSAHLEFTDVLLDDTRRRFAVYALNGVVNWPGTGGAAGTVPASRLSWDSASAYGIALEGAEVAMLLGGNDVELLAPLRIPTMGGALLINRLIMRDYGTEQASGLLDAALEPVQLGQLTGAFGWPAFSGSLSGKLPLLQYEGNAMTVGGSLTANAFGGEIAMSGLRLEQPFGRVPRLRGDLAMRNLDLEQLTDTFSFGLIQGRLSADVTGLEMVAWQPVAMDMHLYTPPADKSKHRISQRAVENLTSVGGGGAGAVLSSGLLKFFEVFAYDRIGLRCVLRAGSCTMSGAGPAGDSALGSGYYIVKGSGIPRIDVVGYRRDVSWERLVRQLGQISSSGSAVVN